MSGQSVINHSAKANKTKHARVHLFTSAEIIPYQRLDAPVRVFASPACSTKIKGSKAKLPVPDENKMLRFFGFANDDDHGYLLLINRIASQSCYV